MEACYTFFLILFFLPMLQAIVIFNFVFFIPLNLYLYNHKNIQYYFSYFYTSYMFTSVACFVPPLLFYFWDVSTSIDISLFILNLHIIFTLTLIYLYILWGWIPRLLLIWSFLYILPWTHVQDYLLNCLLRSGIA